MCVCVLNYFNRERWLVLTKEDAQMRGGRGGGSGRRVYNITVLKMNKYTDVPCQICAGFSCSGEAQLVFPSWVSGPALEMQLNPSDVHHKMQESCEA